MNRKLSKKEKNVLHELKSWPNGYHPCIGSELIPILDSLVNKSYARKDAGNERYYYGIRTITEENSL